MLRKIVASFVGCWMLAAATAFGQINLFENKNLANWNFHAVGDNPNARVNVEDVFAFTDDGRLVSTGLPYGYLVTKEAYKNFKLSLEWRWPAAPTNSGIFLKVTEMPAASFLPKSVEVQLRHNDAGDLWAFHGRTISEPAPRLRNVENATIGRFMGVQKAHGAELPPGQWNAMEILCIEGTIVVTVNGRIVNWTTGAEAIAGQVGFQSEGGPIEFRNAVLTPLP